MTTISEVLPAVEEVLQRDLNGSYAIAIKMHPVYENIGIVLSFRPEQGDYFTHEWVTHDHGRTALLHTGHYDLETYEEAMFDFEARGR